jgi:hypothetical protein
MNITINEQKDVWSQLLAVTLTMWQAFRQNVILHQFSGVTIAMSFSTVLI